MTFEEWWKSTGRDEQYADEVVIREVAEAAWDARRWVSVDERLPEDGEKVIIPALFGEVENARYIHGLWHDGTGRKRTSLAGNYLPPSHWMPLPEPPQEGEG